MLLPHFLVNSNCMENREVSMLNGSGIAWQIKGNKGMAADTAEAALWHSELIKTNISRGHKGEYGFTVFTNTPSF